MENILENFLMSIEQDSDTGVFIANFCNGNGVELEAGTYEDAVLEADMLTEIQ